MDEPVQNQSLVLGNTENDGGFTVGSSGRGRKQKTGRVGRGGQLRGSGRGRKSSGGVSHLPPINRDGRNLSDRKLRRLEMNRLSARECRRKKKEAVEGLQREIAALEAENLSIRLRLQIGEEAEQSNQEEAANFARAMEDLIKKGASETELRSRIDEFHEKFVDSGRYRASEVEFHLRSIDHLLRPDIMTSVISVMYNGGRRKDFTAPPTALQSNAVSSTQSATKSMPSYSRSSKKYNFLWDDSESTATLPSVAQATKPNTHKKRAKTSQQSPSGTSHSEAKESGMSVLASDTAHSDGSDGTSASPCKMSVGTAAPGPIGDVKHVPPKPPTFPTDPDDFYNLIVKNTDITPSQLACFRSFQSSVAWELDRSYLEVTAALKDLEERTSVCLTEILASVETVRSIMTPTQSAKFLVWVANNEACMSMLNELWSRVVQQSIDAAENSITLPDGIDEEEEEEEEVDSADGEGDDSGDEESPPEKK